MKETCLKVSISSFSYKKGIPEDHSGNGGGFIFDCRCIPNPGIYEEYKQLTGMDIEVKEFLEKNETTIIFSSHIHSIVSIAVERYIEREFTHLMVNFGCTGGQHRSVYFAETLSLYLHKQYPCVEIQVNHREQNIQKIV